MTDRQLTSLERLSLTVAGLVIAAAIVGVYTTMQSIQVSQAEVASELAVATTEMRQMRETINRNTERLDRLERNRPWLPGAKPWSLRLDRPTAATNGN